MLDRLNDSDKLFNSSTSMKNHEIIALRPSAWRRSAAENFFLASSRKMSKQLSQYRSTPYLTPGIKVLWVQLQTYVFSYKEETCEREICHQEDSCLCFGGGVWSWLAVLVISGPHSVAFPFSTRKLCYQQVFRRLPRSQHWIMQSVTCQSTSVLYLFNACALNYACLKMQMLEQPAAPEVCSSIVWICGWLLTLHKCPDPFGGCQAPRYCSVCSSSAPRSLV